MEVYRGEKLQLFIENELQMLSAKGVKHMRFIGKELYDYLDTPSDKVCVIFGLRRTGKTTLIYQTIEEKLSCKNALYIYCGNDDSYIELEEIIKNSKEEYFFIDEITKLENFIKLSSSLADCFPDKKIVITGSDSASFLIAKADELYDRVMLIHSTYVSFAEYNYLLGKNLDEYIENGGTLSDGEIIYENIETLEEYINTAIVSNICRSTEKSPDNIFPRRLRDLYLSGSLESTINKAIELKVREFCLRVAQGKNWDSDDVCGLITEKIKMGDRGNVKESDIELITDFLTKMDVFCSLPSGEVVFTQPGIIRCMSYALIKSIVKTGDFETLSAADEKLLLEKIKEGIHSLISDSITKTD